MTSEERLGDLAEYFEGRAAWERRRFGELYTDSGDLAAALRDVLARLERAEDAIDRLAAAYRADSPGGYCGYAATPVYEAMIADALLAAGRLVIDTANPKNLIWPDAARKGDAK
jgi:hypothetical protein